MIFGENVYQRLISRFQLKSNEEWSKIDVKSLSGPCYFEKSRFSVFQPYFKQKWEIWNFSFGNPICLGFATIVEKISSNGQILAKIAHLVLNHLKQATFKEIGAWKQLLGPLGSVITNFLAPMMAFSTICPIY